VKAPSPNFQAQESGANATKEVPSRISRRVALQWISSATAAIPLLEREVSAAEKSGVRPPSVFAKGYGPDPDLTRKYKPGDLWTLTFDKDQRRLMIVLCDIIMPADETSPSASSLGVHDFVDEWISSPYPAQAADRKIILEGVKLLDEKAARRGKPNFVSLKPKDQLTICEDLAAKHLLTYLEAILRVYNRYGRRDNKYKARIKILVRAMTPKSWVMNRMAMSVFACSSFSSFRYCS